MSADEKTTLKFLQFLTPGPDSLEVRPHNAIAVFPLALHVNPRSGMRHGTLTAYVCMGCGYTEMYAVDLENFPWENVPGAQLYEDGKPVARKKPA